MEQRKILLTAKETSLQVFNGKRSPWSLLKDAKNNVLPCMRIGNRIFFEAHSLNDYIENQLKKSLYKGVSEIDGIKKID